MDRALKLSALKGEVNQGDSRDLPPPSPMQNPLPLAAGLGTFPGPEPTQGVPSPEGRVGRSTEPACQGRSLWQTLELVQADHSLISAELGKLRPAGLGWQ